MALFDFKVVATQPFAFTPTDLRLIPLYVLEEEVDGSMVEMVRVKSELTQRLSEGTLTESTEKVIPKAALDALIEAGYEFDSNLPVINRNGLNQLLAAFNLQLAEEY